MTVLSIVIVNYNGGEKLRRCIASLRQFPATVATDVIVVDNASCDGSAEWLAHEDGLALIRLPENLGLTKGFNRGLRGASGEVVLALDADTEVTAGALDAMVGRLLARPGLGACGATLVYPDGTPQRTARRFPSPMSGLFGRRSLLTRAFPDNPFSRRYLMADHEGVTAPFEVDTVSTACMAVSRAALEKVGGFDEAYFVYWSDTDWCHRIKSAGFAIESLPGATVIHNENLSAKRVRRRTRMVVDFHRGAYRYFATHHAGPLNPLRWVAAAALGSRAALILARDEMELRAARKAS